MLTSLLVLKPVETGCHLAHNKADWRHCYDKDSIGEWIEEKKGEDEEPVCPKCEAPIDKKSIKFSWGSYLKILKFSSFVVKFLKQENPRIPHDLRSHSVCSLIDRLAPLEKFLKSEAEDLAGKIKLISDKSLEKKEITREEFWNISSNLTVWKLNLGI